MSARRAIPQVILDATKAAEERLYIPSERRFPGMTADPRRLLDAEAAAAAELTRFLGEAIEDEELHAGMLEGSTGLAEAIDAAVEAIDRAESDSAHLAKRIAQMQARKAQCDAVPRRLKRAIAHTLRAAGWNKTWRRPEYTITRPSTGAPRVSVYDETHVPRRYWRQPDPPPPELDKAAIQAALLAHEDVPGAELVEGELTVSVRRS